MCQWLPYIPQQSTDPGDRPAASGRTRVSDCATTDDTNTLQRDEDRHTDAVDHPRVSAYSAHGDRPMMEPAVAVLQVLGDTLGSDIVDTFPDPLTATGVLFYAAWGFFGVAVLKRVRNYLRRSRSNPTNATIEGGSAGAGGVATKGTTTVGTTSDTGPSLSKGDHAAFVIPGVVPLSKGVREVTHNEIHALELGSVIGFALTWLVSIGRQNLAVTLAGVFIAGALGYKRYRTKALKTVRMEPWYALMALAAGATAGYVFFTPEIAVFGGSLPL